MNALVKSLIDSQDQFKGITIKGEVSGLTMAQSGHWYFSLKDDNSTISVIMYRNNTLRVNFEMKSGITVIVKGSVGVYAQRGVYQIVAEEIKPEGKGSLHEALLKLMEKLKGQGLFEETRKKALPLFPSRIGVIASPTSAAFRDIERVAQRRFPGVEIVLSGCLVQGESAPASIIQAIDLIEQHHRTNPLDVVVLSRGGGSPEDLWCFNDEGLAKRIFDLDIPVVTGIGHEIDISIADMVADVRAATPTAAMELVLPDRTEVQGRVRELEEDLHFIVSAKIGQLKEEVDHLHSSRVLQEPGEPLRERQRILDEASNRMDRAFSHSLTCFRGELEPLSTALEKLSPVSTLDRGYAIVESGSSVVSDPGQVNIDDNIKITLSKGGLEAVVTKKEGTRWKK